MKKILSGLSTSSGFYQAIEKSYNFISVNRFKEVSRLRLDALYKQICVDANQHNFDLVRVGSAHDGGYVMMNPKSPEYEEMKQWAGYWSIELKDWQKRPGVIWM